MSSDPAARLAEIQQRMDAPRDAVNSALDAAAEWAAKFPLGAGMDAIAAALVLDKINGARAALSAAAEPPNEVERTDTQILAAFMPRLRGYLTDEVTTADMALGLRLGLNALGLLDYRASRPPTESP